MCFCGADECGPIGETVYKSPGAVGILSDLDVVVIVRHSHLKWHIVCNGDDSDERFVSRLVWNAGVPINFLVQYCDRLVPFVVLSLGIVSI